MKTYKYFFRVEHSSASISNPYTDEAGQYDIAIQERDNETNISLIDCKSKVEGVMVHHGLLISVDIEADTIDEGLQNAKLKANAVLALVSLVTNATVSEPVFELGYETTPTASKTEFIQLLNLTGNVLMQKRIVNYANFNNMAEHFIKNTDKRTSRAIRWYRKGLMETDSVDRFMSYWLGLENLNNYLSEKLKAKPEKRYCTSCNNPYEPPTSKGIKALFVKYSDRGYADFKKCNRMRNGLQHGFEDMEKLMQKIEEYTELCRTMLLKAILLSLSLEPAILTGQFPEPMYNLKMPFIEFRGFYDVPPKNITEIPILIVNQADAVVLDKGDGRMVTLQNSIESNIQATPIFTSINFITEHGIKVTMSAKLTPKDETAQAEKEPSAQN